MSINNNEVDLVTMTADIVSAYLSNNNVDISEVGEIVRTVHAALLGAGAPVPVAKQEPSVPVRLSIKPDYLICLEDGKKLKLLKRHLMTHYQMTPAQYRAKWGLNSDYPMVAPAYAEKRRELAKMIGLGTKGISGR